MNKFLWAGLILFWASTNIAAGVEVAFDFTGAVSLFSPVFGLSSSASTHPKTISGSFFYDLSSSVATTSLACPPTGCASYEQPIVNGFQATIMSATESVTLQADNYLVQVKNDYTSSGNLRDGLSIIWRSDLTPALDPLIVNGSDQLTGQFRIDLAGLATIFSDASLPATLDWSDFSTLSPASLIGSSVSLPSGFITLTSLSIHPLAQSDPLVSPIPEPSSAAVLIIFWCVQFGAFSFHSRIEKLAMRNTKILAAKHHHAITLTELLVVIAVIASLLALLLPAIQAVRESSYRMKCQQNLKQIGVALLGFDSLHGKLPIGARGSSNLGISWWVSIMPFLEEGDAYERLDKVGANAGFALLNAQNAKIADGFTVGTLSCPSSPLPILHRVGFVDLMMPSYVGIAGATNDDGFPESRLSTCCSPENLGQISSGGVLISNQFIKLQRVTDGLSKTMAVGETSDYVKDEVGRKFRIDGGMPLGWFAGTSASGTPPHYSNKSPVPPSWNITSIRHPINLRHYKLPGIHDNRGANNPLVSAHAGGVNALLLDGSVQFLTNDTEILFLKRMATRDDGQLIR